MIRVGYFLGTFEDWGGASRALLNFIKSIDRQKFTPIAVLTKEGKLCKELDGLGIEYAFCPKHELTRNVISSLYHVLRSIRFLKEKRFDIVHLNYGATEWSSPTVLAAKWLNIPILYHYHSEISEPSRFVRFASAVIVVSDYIKRQADTLGRPTHTIHNIVDLSRFASGHDIRTQLDIPPDCVVVSFVGQVRIIKGISTLLRAIERIDNPHIRFVIAGEFRETSASFTREMFDSAVAKDERIIYLGYRTDVQDLYESSDVIVMPSMYDEPCAMVLFESAAARKPIVASATGGTPEVIEHEITGVLFERDDDAGLAAGINKLAKSRTLRKHMGQQAYERALDKFSKQPTKKLEDLYGGLIAQR